MLLLLLLLLMLIYIHVLLYYIVQLLSCPGNLKNSVFSVHLSSLSEFAKLTWTPNLDDPSSSDLVPMRIAGFSETSEIYDLETRTWSEVGQISLHLH